SVAADAERPAAVRAEGAVRLPVLHGDVYQPAADRRPVAPGRGGAVARGGVGGDGGARRLPAGLGGAGLQPEPVRRRLPDGLNAVWTCYVFVGSYFKDRRLEFFLGDVYRDYEARVPGYPLVGPGPLGRVARVPSAGVPPVAEHADPLLVANSPVRHR